MNERLVHLQTQNHSDGFNYAQKPFLVIWETTRACDLACIHCRASAEPDPDPDELTGTEGMRLIREVKEMGTPILVFSGGDPLKRRDLPDLIRYAKFHKLRTGAIPAVTPLLTPSKIQLLKDCGLDQIAFSLDAADAKEHDAFRKTEGVFERTVRTLRTANAVGIPVQINSLINLHNAHQLDDLIDLVTSFDIVFWEVFFLVPTGRGQEIPLMLADQFEAAFEKLYELSRDVPFLIKITEAPHYRRYYFDREILSEGGDLAAVRRSGIDLPAYMRAIHGPRGSIGRAPAGVNAGKGFIFISHRGEVFPSGFLPLSAGDFRKESLKNIYQDSPLLRALRDPALLKGRCGECPYNEICGGSRSRAYAMTGDYLAEDPCCNFQP